jgi:hypothetical protein
MTTTAICRTIEFKTLSHNQAMVIPPFMLETWEEDKMNTGILRYLTWTFKSNTDILASLP